MLCSRMYTCMASPLCEYVCASPDDWTEKMLCCSVCTCMASPLCEFVCESLDYWGERMLYSSVCTCMASLLGGYASVSQENLTERILYCSLCTCMVFLLCEYVCVFLDDRSQGMFFLLCESICVLVGCCSQRMLCCRECISTCIPAWLQRQIFYNWPGTLDQWTFSKTFHEWNIIVEITMLRTVWKADHLPLRYNYKFTVQTILTNHNTRIWSRFTSTNENALARFLRRRYVKEHDYVFNTDSYRSLRKNSPVNMSTHKNR